MSTVHTLSRSPSKRRERRHDHVENCVWAPTPVWYIMRRCPTEVYFSAVFKRNGRQPTAVQENVLKSHKLKFICLLCPAFVNSKHGANILFTVKEVIFLRKMCWVCEACHHSKEKNARGQGKGSWQGRCQCSSTGGSRAPCKKSR